MRRRHRERKETDVHRQYPEHIQQSAKHQARPHSGLRRGAHLRKKIRVSATPNDTSKSSPLRSAWQTYRHCRGRRRGLIRVQLSRRRRKSKLKRERVSTVEKGRDERGRTDVTSNLEHNRLSSRESHDSSIGAVKWCESTVVRSPVYDQRQRRLRGDEEREEKRTSLNHQSETSVWSGEMGSDG